MLCSETKIEEPFVRDGQDDEDWRKCQEYDHQSMQVMLVGRQTMKEWHEQRKYKDNPSHNLVSSRETSFGL